MSRVITLGRRLSCTASIQRPGTSDRATRLSGCVNISVSNLPMALAEAALFFAARPPMSWRMTGSRHSRSASLSSSHPEMREKTDWRKKPTSLWRPFLPVRGLESTSAATSIRLKASSSSR